MWWNPTPNAPDWLVTWAVAIEICALLLLIVATLRENHVPRRRVIHPSQRAISPSAPRPSVSSDSVDQIDSPLGPTTSR